MLSGSSLERLHQSGWALPSYHSSEVGRFTNRQLELHNRDIENARSEGTTSKVATLFTGVGAYFFPPLAIGTAIFGARAYWKSNVAQNIEKYSSRWGMGHEAIHYLKNLKKDLDDQIETLDRTPPQDLERVIKKISKQWDELGTLFDAFEKQCDKSKVKPLRDCRREVLAVKKVNFKAASVKTQKQRITSSIKKCLKSTTSPGLIKNLIKDQKLLLGHTHKFLVDYIECVR